MAKAVLVFLSTVNKNSLNLPQKCFSKLKNQIVDSRRAADADYSKAIIVLTNKLTGNSLYMPTLFNKTTHRSTIYHSEKIVNRVINDSYFVHLDEIVADLYEVKSFKKKIHQDLSIQVAINVYLNSKLHMLKFFNLFLKKYIPDRCFELLESDTDSLYFSISRQSLDDCVPELLKEAYFKDKLTWMPAEACPSHTNDYTQKKTVGKNWPATKCCSDFNKFKKKRWVR